MYKPLNDISHDLYLFKIEDYVDSSWIGHAPFLKFLIRELKPTTFVELGVHNGFSYFVACQSVIENNLKTRCFAIDHWQGDSHVGSFDEAIYRDVEMKNEKYRNFSTLVRKDFNEAVKDFDERSIDLLHIDGHHSYESVSNDFFTWLPKINSNGIIILHDIFVHRNTFGVYKFWKEITQSYRTMEFTHSHGLGIVFLGQSSTKILDSLFEFSAVSDGMSQIQGTFGSIADDVIQQSGFQKSNLYVAERDSAVVERDSAVAERDSAVAERDSAVAERDSAVVERDSAVVERDSAVAERDSAVAERDSAVAERDSAVAERDSAVAERDSAVVERDSMLNSTIWALFAPYRKAKDLFRKN